MGEGSLSSVARQLLMLRACLAHAHAHAHACACSSESMSNLMPYPTERTVRAWMPSCMPYPTVYVRACMAAHAPRY